MAALPRSSRRWGVNRSSPCRTSLPTDLPIAGLMGVDTCCASFVACLDPAELLCRRRHEANGMRVHAQGPSRVGATGPTYALWGVRCDLECGGATSRPPTALTTDRRGGRCFWADLD